MFRTNLGEAIFKQKYASNAYESWVKDLAARALGGDHAV